jgi:hypothetical protein
MAPKKTLIPVKKAANLNDTIRVPMAVPNTLLKLFRPNDQLKNKPPNTNK